MPAPERSWLPITHRNVELALAIDSIKAVPAETIEIHKPYRTQERIFRRVVAKLVVSFLCSVEPIEPSEKRSRVPLEYAIAVNQFWIYVGEKAAPRIEVKEKGAAAHHRFHLSVPLPRK